MRTRRTALLAVSAISVSFCFPIASAKPMTPSVAAIDAEVSKIMTRTGANGMAVAVIDHGKIEYVRAYGSRNTQGDPLTTDTVMYGASLTKTVFRYTVMQVVDQGKLKLDEPIRGDLPPASTTSGSSNPIRSCADTGVPYDWEYGDRAGKS